jgi:hypothetical protein
VEPSTAQAQPDRVSIAAGATVTTKGYGVSTERLLARARQQNAALIEVQVRIAKVEFQDGLDWVAEAIGPVFDPDSLQLAGKQCSAGKLIDSAAKSSSCQQTNLTARLITMKTPYPFPFSEGWGWLY